MTKLLGLVLGVGLVLSASPASANPPGETRRVDDGGAYYGGEYVDRAEQRHRMRAIRERIKARFDADGDGRLSREERRAAKQAMGPMLGKGKATLKKKLRKVKKAIRRYDRDGDGVVGPGEAPAHVVRKLRKLDRNGDGWVNDDDFGGRGRGVR